MLRDTKAQVKRHIGFGVQQCIPSYVVVKEGESCSGPGGEQHVPFAASFLLSSKVLTRLDFGMQLTA